MNSPHTITNLLLAWGQGDESALEQLMPLVMGELRRLAKRYMRQENQGHTLQTSDLVNEAFIKLIDLNRIHWKNRAQFFGIAANCMRQILIDHARGRMRAKRGSGAEHIELSDASPIPVENPIDPVELLALDKALHKLAKQHKQTTLIVTLRYFGGFTVEEVAEILKVPKTTVEREWSFARAWLGRELGAKPKTVQTSNKTERTRNAG
jgi:RNA polymerase sigma-70 factor, ECF subfamily